jgi:diguanylate cyclase (GGDEF)-like protein
MTAMESDVRTAVASAGERLGGLLEQSEECKRVGQHQEGVRLSQRAAELAELLGDAARHARALRLQALHLFRIGEYEACARTGERARALLEGLNDPAGLCDALATTSMAYNEMGLHDEALQSVTGCLDAAQKSADRTQLCWAFNRVGCVHDAMGNSDRAREFLRHALELAREIDDHEALFSALINLTEVTLSLAERLREEPHAGAVRRSLDESLPYAEEALAEARQYGNRHQVAMAQGNLGMMIGLSGDFDGAIKLIREARDVAQQHGYKPVARIVTLYEAELLSRRGDASTAIMRLNSLLDEALHPGEKALLTQVRTQLYMAYKVSGAFREALAEHEQVLALDRERNATVAGLRARMLINRLELDNARLQAERSRLTAELHRLKSAQLEQEKQVLEARTLELDRRVNEDQLTGLWNRRYVETVLPRLFDEAKTLDRRLGVGMIDLDHFKSINERVGHFAADEVLRRVAGILRRACGPDDFAARLGGEEFVMVMAARPLSPSVGLCESLRLTIETQPWHEIHPELKVTISIGVCDDTEVSGYGELLSRADSLLFQAKRNGRNRVEFIPM